MYLPKALTRTPSTMLNPYGVFYIRKERRTQAFQKASRKGQGGNHKGKQKIAEASEKRNPSEC